MLKALKWVYYGMAAIGVVFLLFLAPVLFWETFRAALGMGAPGTFRAGYLQCQRDCVWYGTFTSTSGRVIPSVAYNDPVPAGIHPGKVLPALYPGGSHDVFARHGSTAWLRSIFIVFFPLGVIALLAWHYGPIRAFLDRRAERAAAAPPFPH